MTKKNLKELLANLNCAMNAARENDEIIRIMDVLEAYSGNELVNEVWNKHNTRGVLNRTLARIKYLLKS